jgi:glyoxylase-like metal-dependent hydrolase (beta-lactamase superfamily II)
MTSVNSGKLREVRPDVAYYTDQIVNVVMLGEPTGDWVLVDAGMPKHGDQILRVCEKRFGENHPPSAIVLTHGHFDHVGSITELLSHTAILITLEVLLNYCRNGMCRFTPTLSSSRF